MGKRQVRAVSLRRRTCADVIALLTDYLEGSLPPAERAVLEEHLSGCSACTEFLRSLRATSAAVTRLRSREIPGEVRDRLRSFLGLGLPAGRA